MTRSVRALRDLPLQARLIATILFVSAATGLSVSAFLLGYDIAVFRRQSVVRLAALGGVIAENSSAALAFHSPEEATQTLAALRADARVTAGALYDPSGALFAKYPASAPDTAFPAPGADGFQYSNDGPRGFQPVLQSGKRLGTLYLASNLEALHDRIRVFATILGLVALASFVLTWILSVVVQRGISRPILALARVSAQVSDTRDYSVRAPKLTGAEIGRLTDAFNHMLDEIEQLNGELEARVRSRTAELEAANRELEAFNYSISHDLRAPLRHITGFAEMLEQELAGTLNDDSRRYLATIQRAAGRLGNLIDALLDFSRQGRGELNFSTVDTAALVDETLHELAGEHAGRTVEVSVGELPPVVADRALLRQVWANLLHNAIKYTRRREVARIRISHRRDESLGHVFSVQDNGAGFDMQAVDQLFGVFKRLHRADEFEGTGIGLANVHRIILRHGGKVGAEGEPDQGATFWFSLPA